MDCRMSLLRQGCAEVHLPKIQALARSKPANRTLLAPAKVDPSVEAAELDIRPAAVEVGDDRPFDLEAEATVAFPAAARAARRGGADFEIGEYVAVVGAQL